MPSHTHQLRMPAGNQQCDERKLRRRVGKQGREQVAFQVVDADSRHAERVGQGAGDARPDQQCAGQAGACV